MTVASCQSDTQLTLAAPYNNTGFLPSGSGWSYSFIPENLWNTWVYNVTPYNFYDAITALYSLYYRSGIDDYLNTARMAADAFWQFRLDSGGCYHYGDGSCWHFLVNQAPTGMVPERSTAGPTCGLELSRWRITRSPRTTFRPLQMATGPKSVEIRAKTAICWPSNPTALCSIRTPRALRPARAGIREVMTKGWTASRFPDGNWYSLYWGGWAGRCRQSL